MSIVVLGVAVTSLTKALWSLITYLAIIGLCHAAVLHVHSSTFRIVITTVRLDEEGGEGHEKLILEQRAEKDLKYNKDSLVSYEGDGDVLNQTMTVFTKEGPVVGYRKFLRYIPYGQPGYVPYNDMSSAANKEMNRKLSSPF